VRTAGETIRGILVALWPIPVGLAILGCVNLLVAMKTGSPLTEIAGAKGLDIPAFLLENPGAFFFLNCAVAPGYFSRPFEPGIATACLLSILGLALGGGVFLYRSASGEAAGDRSAGAELSLRVAITGAGILTAGAFSFLLEILGLWKKLAIHPDLHQEQGAPFWFWWLSTALAVALWFLALRKSGTPAGTWRGWVKRLGALSAGALLIAALSLIFHITQPEPTQGRYYGIAGFVVGRAGNSEYGSYYGVVSGIVVFLLASIRLAQLLLSAHLRRK
jgi:hypothetical protein